MIQIRHQAIDAGADEAIGHQLVEDVQVLALALRDHRREQHDAAAFGQLQHLVHHLAHRLRIQRLAVLRTARLADPREQEAQIVVDFGDGADRGARVVGGGLLLDGNGRRQPLDVVYIRLLHHGEELPRVGRQGFHIAPLALGIQGVERQGGLAGPRQAGDDDQLIAGNVQIDVLQVVRARATHRDRAHRSGHASRAERPKPAKIRCRQVGGNRPFAVCRTRTTTLTPPSLLQGPSTDRAGGPLNRQVRTDVPNLHFSQPRVKTQVDSIAVPNPRVPSEQLPRAMRGGESAPVEIRWCEVTLVGHLRWPSRRRPRLGSSTLPPNG